MEIKKADYFNILTGSHASDAWKLLAAFAEAGIGLLAFRAVPAGHAQTKYSLFPVDGFKMKEVAEKAGINLDGPHSALIVKSNSDEPGECAGIFEKLSQADIIVGEASGIADIYDSYGVVLYLDQADCAKAMDVLKINDNE